jgi:predicted nucleic acid-binding protein
VNLIVDASVALKWFVNEHGSAQALELRASHNLYAPDLLLIECRNAILNKVRRRIISSDDARQVESGFDLSGITIFPSAAFLSDAFQIALEVSAPIYDCIYLASAISSDRILVTADERFLARVTTSTFAAGRIRLLAEMATGA